MLHVLGWGILQTDTASVLMEAIGYIKFLQSQVEVLLCLYTDTIQKNILLGTCSILQMNLNLVAQYNIQTLNVICFYCLFFVISSRFECLHVLVLPS